MGYHTMKRFAINRKKLTISYKATCSNAWDMYGRKEVVENTLKFNTLEELEDKVLSFAEGHLDGVTQFAQSSTMVKRINWLQDNGYITNKGIQDDETTRKVLTGEKKVKINLYQFYSKEGYPIVYNSRNMRVSIYMPYSNKKATKVTNHLAEELEGIFSDFFENHGVYRVLVEA